MWILFGLKKKGEDKGEGEEGEGREEKRKGEKRKGKGKDKCCLEKKKKKKERKPLLANHGILPMIICNGADWSSCLQLFMSCTWCISALAELQITQKLEERGMEESWENLRKHHTLVFLFLSSTLLKGKICFFCLICA